MKINLNRFEKFENRHIGPGEKQIAKMLDMVGCSDMEQLLDEMGSIVNSGTKLNIDYYLGDVVDEEVQEIIYEYFMEAESDSLEIALKELEDDEIELEELQLIRLKFLSEMAN